MQNDQLSSSSSRPVIELAGSISFRSGDQNWGSQRRMALLAAIGQEGSISAAARKVGLSYKAAWDAVDTMNNLAGEPLVLRTTGGRHGGGATLSERGVKLLTLFERLERQHREFMAQLARNGNLPGAGDTNLALIQNMMIQTSARNCLAGTITRVTHGAVNDEIILHAAEGLDIIANITSESTHSLGLAPGKRALAFIKASSIIVGQPGEGMRLSARNQLAGHIREITPGSINADLRIELPSGHMLGATLTLDSLNDMALKAGDPVLAIFKASSVMIGVTE
ncbi:TOBE domain-containing protein [Paracandidimonas lactea]|uniref:TOBE domain-containing protein n=1 Tax=Paracandidimonas lactea TaxID=2895524 RepID=UPI001F295D74|nr:TOBE domain-containing protein [Paracandidimonas lactea]